MPINQSLQMWGVYKAQGLDVSFDVVHGAGHGGELFFAPPQQEVVEAFWWRVLGGK
jgi:hypothetical protein